MKPVELVECAVKNSSNRRDIVLDFFCYSGTRAIACEKTNRDPRFMALNPTFVDFMVKRWEAFTGKKAVLHSAVAVELDTPQALDENPLTN